MVDMKSSSFGSQFPAHMTGPVPLSLFKLSFCTTATLRSNLLWTHLPNRDDLFAVFDSVYHKDLEGPVTEKKVLKLVRGGDLLVGSLSNRPYSYFLLICLCSHLCLNPELLKLTEPSGEYRVG